MLRRVRTLSLRSAVPRIATVTSICHLAATLHQLRPSYMSQKYSCKVLNFSCCLIFEIVHRLVFLAARPHDECQRSVASGHSVPRRRPGAAYIRVRRIRANCATVFMITETRDRCKQDVLALRKKQKGDRYTPDRGLPI